MKILALDSSGKSLSLALVEDGLLTAERYLNLGYTHSETLMPQMLALLQETGRDFADLEALAVSTGPGSYTGIRIGLATMKTLAWSLGVPLYSFSSLDMLTTPYRLSGLFLLASIDARRGRNYSICYKGEKLILPAENRSAEELVQELCETFYAGKADPPTLYLLGDGSLDIYAAAQAQAASEEHFKMVILDAGLAEMRAQHLASLAAAAWEAGQRPQWSEAQAFYCSPTQAERVRKEQLSDIKIRPATLDDLSDIHNLECACFPTPWSQKSLKAQLEPGNKHARLFVACRAKKPEDTEEILAYGGYSQHVDEGDILNIAVRDDSRRKGIGRKLLKNIMTDAQHRGVERLVLEVRESNLPAQDLYRSLGFEICGRRKNYYEKPYEDALLMAWQ